MSAPWSAAVPILETVQPEILWIEYLLSCVVDIYADFYWGTEKTCNIQNSNCNFPDWFWFWTKQHPTQGHGVVQRSSMISHRIIYTLFIYERTEYFD